MTSDRPARSTAGLPARTGIDVSQVRRHNVGTLVEHLHRHGPASRSALGTATQLGRSTILDLVQDLMSRDLVFEEGLTTSTGPGRPSPIVHLRPEAAVVVAVEIGVEDIAVALVGLGGHVFDDVRVDLAPREHRPEDTARTVASLADGLLARSPLRGAVVRVAVAVPGPTRRDDGFVHLAPNLGWKAVAFGELLAEAFELPAAQIVVANEADLAALGELRRGIGRGRQNLVFVSGGVGIGVGIILDGRPMLGAAGYAGEAGHMVVNPRGRPCTCGSTGCWETEAGGAALVRAAGGTPAGGPADIRAVADRLAAGDRDATRAADEIGRWLGLGVSNLVKMVNPEVVVLGGIYQSLFVHLEPAVTSVLREHAMPEMADLVTVAPSELGTTAPLHGAAELGLVDFLHDPLAVLGRTERGGATP